MCVFATDRLSVNGDRSARRQHRGGIADQLVRHDPRPGAGFEYGVTDNVTFKTELSLCDLGSQELGYGKAHPIDAPPCLSKTSSKTPSKVDDGKAKGAISMHGQAWAFV
jgi:hypothetical protein